LPDGLGRKKYERRLDFMVSSSFSTLVQKIFSIIKHE